MIREMFLNAYGTEVLRLPLEQTQEEDEEGVVSPTAYELSVGHLSVAQRRLRGETPPDGLARDLWDRFKMSDDYPRPPTRDSYSSQRKPYHQRYNQDSRARDLMDNDFRRSFNPDRSRYARSMDRYSSRTKRAEPYRDTRADSYRGAVRDSVRHSDRDSCRDPPREPNRQPPRQPPRVSGSPSTRPHHRGRND